MNKLLYLGLGALSSGIFSLVLFFLNLALDSMGIVIPKVVISVLIFTIALASAFRTSIGMGWVIDFTVGTAEEKNSAFTKFLLMVMVNEMVYLVFLGLLILLGMALG